VIPSRVGLEQDLERLAEIEVDHCVSEPSAPVGGIHGASWTW
jgi:hypothetical protein